WDAFNDLPPEPTLNEVFILSHGPHRKSHDGLNPPYDFCWPSDGARETSRGVLASLVHSAGFHLIMRFHNGWSPALFPSHPRLAGFAHVRALAGCGCEGEFGHGDAAVGAVPEFAARGFYGQEADGGIVLVFPPGLGEIVPDVLDLGAVVGNGGLAGDHHVIV